MKGVVFLGIAGLLTMVILTMGCAPKKTPSPTPAPAAPTYHVNGVLKDVNVPAEPGKDVVIVQTSVFQREAEKTFPITAGTTFTLEGKTCSLDQVEQLDLAKQSYNCTTVYGYDKDGYEQVISVDLVKIYP